MTYPKERKREREPFTRSIVSFIIIIPYQVRFIIGVDNIVATILWDLEIIFFYIYHAYMILYYILCTCFVCTQSGPAAECVRVFRRAAIKYYDDNDYHRTICAGGHTGNAKYFFFFFLNVYDIILQFRWRYHSI